jgi:hypothetical protein
LGHEPLFDILAAEENLMTVKRVWQIPILRDASLKGRIPTTLEAFANTFGFGHDGPEAKTTTEWYFNTSYGVVCVYDYYYKERAPQLSIGSVNYKAAHEAIEYFNKRGFEAVKAGPHAK